MGFLDTGRSGLALAFAGSMVLPSMCDIGSGSGAFAITRTGLIAPLQTAVYTTRDISTQMQTLYIFDYSSVTMSGINFREFGLRTSGGGLGSGTYFSIDNTSPITYDGSNELQIQITYQVY